MLACANLSGLSIGGCGDGFVAVVYEAVMDVIGAGHDVAASAAAGVETWLR